jgi:hypothetical protein
MGLDQYAYVAGRKGQRSDYYSARYLDKDVRVHISPPQDLAYWRKHPNLQGWMERLWISKGSPGEAPESPFGGGTMFNGVELELTWDDVDKLEKDIKSGRVANLDTRGSFFGHPSDDYYREYDLQFCVDAKAELFLGRKVFYNSSW